MGLGWALAATRSEWGIASVGAEDSSLDSDLLGGYRYSLSETDEGHRVAKEASPCGD